MIQHVLKFVFLLYIFCAPNLSFAQKGIVYGIIVDGNTKEPLPFANVGIAALNLGANTDLSGKYRIANVPEGTHKLTISYVGYNAFDVEITIKDGQSLEVNQSITEGVSLDAVTISAQAVGQRAAINEQINSNTIVTVISKEKLQELPDQNAAESLGRLAGVAIQRDGGEGTKVSVRGLSPRFVSVTVNGERVPSTDSEDRSVDLAMISPEMLAGIEVYKSTRPDMDGDAIGGTVNFAVKKADETPKSDLKILNTGNFQENKYALPRISASHSQRFLNKKLGVVATGNFQRANRGSDNLDITTRQTGNTSAGQAIIGIESISLADRLETRDRAGASLTFDFSPSAGHTILLASNYGYTNQDATVRRRRYRYADSRQQYDIRDGERQTSLLSSTLSGEHNFGAWTLNWRGAWARSEQKTPESVFMNFMELAASSGGVQNPLDAKEVISIFKNNVPETFLFDSRYGKQATSERNNGFQVDVKRSLVLGKKINGYIKFGGKIRNQSRKNDNTEWLVRPYLTTGTEGIGRDFPTTFITQGTNILMSNFLTDDYRVDNFLGGAFDANIGTAAFRQTGSASFTSVDVAKHNALFGTNFTNSSKIGYNGHLDANKAWAFYRQYKERYRRDGLINFDDYEGSERILATYAMTELNLTKYVQLVGGLRYEYTNTDYSAVSGEAADIEDNNDLTNFAALNANKKRSYGEFLPSVQTRIKPVNWFDVRLAAYRTLSRPTYRLLLPMERISQKDLSIRRGNPNLLHTTAWNYDAFLSFYNKYGLFTVGGFYKELSNIDYEFREKRIIDASKYNGFRLTSAENIPLKSKIKGVEIDAQTNLSSLNGFVKGFVIGANITLLQTETFYPFFDYKVVSIPEPPFVKTLATDTLRGGPVANQPKLIGNFMLGYETKGFSGRISYTYQDDKLATLTGFNETDIYTGSAGRFDVALKQKMNKRLTIMFNLNNITNTPERSLIPGFNNLLIEDERFGMTGDLGLQIKF
jgi:TonB-dependent receptor